LARTISYNACKQLLIVHLQIETEEDELWGPDFREEKEQIKARGLKFMQWLMTRPEQRIAVVSHSSFLFFTMANFGLHAPALIQVKISACRLHASHLTYPPDAYRQLQMPPGCMKVSTTSTLGSPV